MSTYDVRVGRAAVVTAAIVSARGDECEVPERMQASVRGCPGAIDLTTAFKALQDVAPVSSLTSSPVTLPLACSNPATLAFPSSQCAKRSLPPGLCTCCFLRPECPPHSFAWLAFSTALQLRHDIFTEVFSAQLGKVLPPRLHRLLYFLLLISPPSLHSQTFTELFPRT